MKYSTINITIWTWLIVSLGAFSQTNEIGLFLGGSMFHGDIGHQNAEQSIYNSKPVIGIQLKRNFNYHFGIQISILRGNLYASDNNSQNDFFVDRNLKFKSKITEFSLALEFNFRSYLSRDNDYNSTPFVFAGFSKFYFKPQGESLNGIWHNLQPLNTEGQGSDLYPNRDIYKLNGIAIPIGIGYKINIYEYITLSFNCGWRLTFNDYIDDVSSTYVNESVLNSLGEELADLSSINFEDGFQRGDPYSNDKYGFFGISILYSIADPNKGCNNIVY